MSDSPVPPPLGSALLDRPGPALARLELLDALRGFALLGVLVVNMMWFSSSRDLAVLREFGVADGVVLAAVTLLAEWKFIIIFSFLFGLGFALQMQRAAGDPDFPRRFCRGRLRWLFYFGLIHGSLVWMGDILLAYSVAGLMLVLFFRSRSERTLLAWAAALVVALPLLAGVGATAAGWAEIDAAAEQRAARLAPPPAVEERTWDEGNLIAAWFDEEFWSGQLAAWYRDGSWGEVATARLIEWAGTTAALPIYVLPLLGLFLLGVVAGRRGLLADPAAHAATLRRMLGLGLAVGLPLNAAYLAAVAGPGYLPELAEMPARALVVTVACFIGAPALSAAYVAGFALLWSEGRWRGAQRVLAPVGRMALTNYLTQSVVCTTIFYGFGLGLYNELGTATTTALALLIFAAQVVASHWWLRRFRFGPMEWVWRRLSYGEAPPMRGAAEARAADADVAA